MKNLNVELGDLVRDQVTGFTGIVVSRCEWLNRCVRVGVQPRALHEGKPVESQTFDEEQLEVVEKKAVVLAKVVQTGGDRPAMHQAVTPSRR